jgi:hypothetical protein
MDQPTEQPATLEDALAELKLAQVERDQFALLHRNEQARADSAVRAVEALRMKLHARAGVFHPGWIAQLDQDLADADHSLDIIVWLYVMALQEGTDAQALTELRDLVDGMPAEAQCGFAVSAVRRLALQKRQGAAS